MIDINELKTNLSYNQETGEFTRLIQNKNNRHKAGQVCGHKEKSGYVRVSVCNKRYQAHTLAWFYVHEEWVKIIDHIDGNPSNNAISNLRPCTQSENCMNRTKKTKAASGHKGVYWNENKKLYVVNIFVRGVRLHFKTYKDYELACLVADEARDKWHGKCATHF